MVALYLHQRSLSVIQMSLPQAFMIMRRLAEWNPGSIEWVLLHFILTQDRLLTDFLNVLLRRRHRKCVHVWFADIIYVRWVLNHG